MAMTTDVQELVELEYEYWQAIKEMDMPTLLRLTDDPCIVVGPQGHAVIHHATYKSMMDNSQWKLLNYKLSDVQAHMIHQDVAAVAYKLWEEFDLSGERVTLEAADSSVWVRKNEQWVCSVHTESVLGDPFGRDRKPTAKKE